MNLIEYKKWNKLDMKVPQNHINDDFHSKHIHSNIKIIQIRYISDLDRQLHKVSVCFIDHAYLRKAILTLDSGLMIFLIGFCLTLHLPLFHKI